ncbi:glycerol transporter [Coemansia interrupta]|uniref:Glycerol transporter n=1 Tax=Coemansia interrupta TaxID=1126814 RepID=A0A9W8HRR9_9FUNG|nr:glycerol transporter [Coemansia interrupta]
MRTPAAPLWGTAEFKVYYAIYVIAVCSMVYTMVQASSPRRGEYHEYSHSLSEGWLFGRQVDMSDGQWRTFRSNLPAFVLAMFAYVALNWVFRLAVLRRLCAGFFQKPASVQGALPTLWFPFVFATAFAMVLSGTSIVFILVITGGNYLIAKKAGGRRWAPILIWAYNMGVLFSNENFKGYEFGRISHSLGWLDGHRGILRRWDITFNLTMLRMVSFSMDYHWRVRQDQEASPRRVDAMVANPKTDKNRIEHSCFKPDYCLVNYWAYLLYPPLYLTGPIITFNNFVSQMRYPSPSVAVRTTVIYGIRLLCSAFLMELMLHFVYCVAISKWGHWDTFSAYEISMIGYMRLNFIWLKLFIIWRFARFWAMADGLDTVENMRRCMSNNYSLQQFWRDWHCSFNKWLVRYVYIPLGGRRTSTWNTFVVFTFVALWHDLTMRLLQWAWLIALLFLPEGLATWYFSKPRWTSRPYFRFICSAGGALNIIAMMIANLVGFGDAGVEKMLEKIFCRQGVFFLFVTYLALNVHLQVMFELREHEYRREYAAHNRPPSSEWEMSASTASEDTIRSVRTDGSPSAPATGAGSLEMDQSASSGSSPSLNPESLTKRQQRTSASVTSAQKHRDHCD